MRNTNLLAAKPKHTDAAMPKPADTPPRQRSGRLRLPFVGRGLLIYVALLSFTESPLALAQPGTLNGIGAYGPVVEINRSVTAQGDFIRSQGDAYEAFQRGNVNYAIASQELAQAVDMEIDNWLKRVQTYYDRKLEHEKSKMELFEVKEEVKDQYAVRRENGRRRLMETLLNDPELTGASVERGMAMNKLLAQFYNTPLAYGIELGPTLERELGDRMDLTPDMISAISIQTSNNGGGVSTFKLNQSMSLDLSWWPDLLRAPEYEAHRKAVELQRQKLSEFAKPKTTVPPETLAAMEKSIGEMVRTFYKLNPPGGRKGMPADVVRNYIRAEEFIGRLVRDMQRIRDTGQASAIGVAATFDAAKHGKDLPSLITWMIRSGVTFGPATPGAESIYRTVFTQMRELYIHVAE